MKIVVVSTPIFVHCPPQGTLGYSGLEVIAWQLAKGLAAKGHQVSLVAPDGSSCPGVQILTTGPAGVVSEKMAYGGGKGQLPDGRVVEAPGYWQHLVQADVIVDHSWEKWSQCLKQEGRIPKVPILAVCHAPVDTMFKSLPPPGVLSFVCISEDQGQHFRGLFNRDCRVCYNGIDLDFYKPLDVPRSKRFLFLGRFSTIKGPDLAIEACRRAGVGLDLIGDTQITNEPEYLKKCYEMAADSYYEGGDKTIRMVGPANRGECVWWFSQAHCMVHPVKNFREPFGLAPVESMACGCPVIAWDNGACRETVISGETGWLVKSEKELERQIQFAAGYGEPPAVRKRCREQASNFSVQRMVDRYEELCHEAVQTGGWR